MIKITSKTTITCLLLKQHRLNNDKRQAIFAKAVNSSGPQWSKVENGKAILTLDTTLLACDFLNITPSQLFDEVEAVATFLTHHDWQVVPATLEDDLLVKAISFSKAAARTLGLDKIPAPEYVVSAIESASIPMTVLDALVVSEGYANKYH